MADANSKKWYERKEFWGAVLTTASSLLLIFPSNTVAHQIGATINVAVGTGLLGIGAKKGYQADNLPSGLTKVMDMIPDKITGVKGENAKL